MLETLRLSEHPKKDIIRHHLKAHATVFSAQRSLSKKLPTIHQDAQRMRGISGLVSNLKQELDDLHPLIYMGLNMSYSEKTVQGTGLKHLEVDLDVLKKSLKISVSQTFQKNNQTIFYEMPLAASCF